MNLNDVRRFSAYVITIYHSEYITLRRKINAESQDYPILNDILCRIQNIDNNEALQASLLVIVPEKYQKTFLKYAP